MEASTIRIAGADLVCSALLLWPSYAAAERSQFTDWSAPMHLGAVVNSSFQDFSPQLSPDGLSLYFCSDRPDGFGELDIWVSHRKDKHDDFGWGPPVNLGPYVNSEAEEVDPAFLPGKGLYDGHTFYFVRSDGTATGEQDIYQTGVTRRGIPREPAVPVTEINSVGRLDGSPSLRKDGRELVFWSNRAGGLGGADVWSATRPHANAPWSPPESLGSPVNTSFAEITVGMTFDGQQLYVAKGFQLGGLGLRDLWVSTRERIGDDQEEECEEDDD